MALSRASLLENAGFNAMVVVPNVAQGIFRRRGAAVRAATAAGIDTQAVRLLAGMSRQHDGGPVWVRLGLDSALLLLDPADIERVLTGSPDDYAADPEAKRKGMVHFQPDALTISRGEDWRSRRAFAEAVLAGVAAMTRHVERVTAEEIAALLAEGDVLGWQQWNKAVQRVARRVVLGDAAAGDWALTDTLERMMGGANGMPGTPSDDLPAFQERVAAYIARAEPGSLAHRFADAPVGERTQPEGQLTHWLFALGDTLAANALRALAVLAHSPEHAKRALADDSGEYLDACLHEAMRLWPTTPMLSRETLTDISWDGETIPAGTQIVIVNTYCHRDPDRLDYADRFVPEEWLDGGDAAGNPAFNHFSRGPQGCPGVELAMLVGRTALRAALEHGVTARSPSLPADRPMPQMLDYFAIRLAVG